MVVAVQKGLDDLARELLEMGFDMVECGEDIIFADAFVYMGQSIPPLANISSSKNASTGVFMVNAQGKTAKQIADILNRRTYTPLF